MFFRILLLPLLFSLSLLAAPSMEQMKAMVQQNPDLLNTPQAEAMMREKGISKADIKSRLTKSQEMTKDIIAIDDIENSIDFRDANETNSSMENNVTDLILEEKIDLGKRLNPFAYKTSQELRESLNARQQILTDKKLTRYSDTFYANKNSIDSASRPTPDDYILSTGDILEVHIYGDRNKRYELELSNDGSVDIEFIGPVRIGGMSFIEAKKHLKSKLKHHFKMSSFKVVISKYSSIQVTLIGDVKYPGIYNLSSFSTAKDLFVEAKGVRKGASVREIDIKRKGKTIAKLDFYDLLFKGKTVGTTLLKHGDIVVVKKAKKLVSIDGFVNHAAIFELNDSETLKTLIKYAGGMKADASSRHIKIDRYSNNSIFETFHLSYSKARKFKMKDGDKVYIYQLDSSADTSVNIYGNVIRPGSYSLAKKSSLTDLLNGELNFGMKRFFLPETYFEYGLIKRYSRTLNYETKSFNLSKVIKGEETVPLHPQDEIFIFSQNDLRTSTFITTKGDVLIEPGKLRYFEGMTLRDAVNGAGVDGILDDQIRVTTINTPDRMPKTIFYSYKKDASVKLSAYDEVEVYDYYEMHLLQPISIKGEVINPTTVFYEKGMTLQNLLESSGGFTVEAFLNRVEIVRYFIDEKSNRKKKILNLDLCEIDKNSYILEPYDEVTIYKIPNWNEKRVVTLKGEVKFPGKYTVSNGERLSSVIKRAGGFTEEAFIDGAVFTRDSIRKQQIDQYHKALSRIKRELAIYNAMPANSKKAVGSSEASNTLNEVILEAQKYQPIGRVSIQLEYDLEKLKRSEFDLVLKNLDEITIPNQIDTVTVFGEVFNPTSFVYSSEISSEKYIEMASGLSRSADEDSIYVIHANGTSELLATGWFSDDVEIKKGDTIVVPLYIKETNQLEVWDSVSRILASFAITVATINTLGII